MGHNLKLREKYKEITEKMATSFFGKFSASRTQSNQRPKINIRNLRKNIGPSTIIINNERQEQQKLRNEQHTDMRGVVGCNLIHNGINYGFYRAAWNAVAV